MGLPCRRHCFVRDGLWTVGRACENFGPAPLRKRHQAAVSVVHDPVVRSIATYRTEFLPKAAQRAALFFAMPARIDRLRTTSEPPCLKTRRAQIFTADTVRSRMIAAQSLIPLQVFGLARIHSHDFATAPLKRPQGRSP